MSPVGNRFSRKANRQDDQSDRDFRIGGASNTSCQSAGLGANEKNPGGSEMHPKFQNTTTFFDFLKSRK
jgi:hypothetical protein